MTPKQQRPRLQFQQIAAEWSEEPGGLPRDESLQRLLAAVWLGEFEDGAGASCLTLDTFDTLERDGNSLNRRELLTALKAYSWETIRHINIPDDAYIPATHDIAVQNNASRAPLWPGVKKWRDLMERPWESVRDSVPWEELASLRLDQYTSFFLETYVEPPSISKGDFQAWCSRRETDPPEFWFPRAKTEADASTSKSQPAGGLTKQARSKGSSRSRYNRWLQEALERIVVMLNEEGTPATQKAVWKWLKENSSSSRPYEFEPPIPGCDELYVDGDALIFTDEAGNDRSLKYRSLDPYTAQAIGENPPKPSG